VQRWGKHQRGLSWAGLCFGSRGENEKQGGEGESGLGSSCQGYKHAPPPQKKLPVRQPLRLKEGVKEKKRTKLGTVGRRPTKKLEDTAAALKSRAWAGIE